MTFSSRNIGAARAGIAIMVLLLYGLALAVLIYVEIPVANKEVMLLLLGNLGPLLGAIGGYYFNIGTKRGTGGT